MKIRIIVIRSLKVHVRYVHERKNPREVRFGSHLNLHIENVHDSNAIFAKSNDLTNFIYI